MILRASFLSFLIMLTAATVPATAQTQMSSGVPLYWVNNPPAELVSASFTDPYGSFLIAEFAAVLSESGDAACLQTKGIQKNQIAERARAILLRVGA